MIDESAVPVATSLLRSPGILAYPSRQARGRRREDGPRSHCALDHPGGPRSTTDWLDEYERFWTESLDQLAEHLADVKEEDHTDDDDPPDTG
jgi:hypothetical protein